jgi:uncharacterized membrane protein YqaE (UPF0057 family)
MKCCCKKPHLVGLALGAFFGLIHALWSVVVALGWAKPLIDWILGMHFIEMEFQIADFVFWKALILVVLTAVVGYVVGLVFAMICKGFCCR